MTPFFFFFGVRCAQYKVHAQCSFAALAPHMPCMLLVYILSYVRRGLCDPLFFFLRRALCAVQSSCTVLFRCARPTHALHASSKIAGYKNDVHVGLVFTRLQKECRRVNLSSSMLSVLHFALRTTYMYTYVHVYVHNVSHMM